MHTFFAFAIKDWDKQNGNGIDKHAFGNDFLSIKPSSTISRAMLMVDKPVLFPFLV
jgi:hypothetical protein